jgi:hypothetical protein
MIWIEAALIYLAVSGAVLAKILSGFAKVE